jgi:hypothetical protein
MNDEFVGHLSTFDKKGQGEEIIDENVLLEVIEVKNDGTVEVAFTDRNERCYLSFKLPELLQHIFRHSIEAEKQS